ncbi:hypothetical protein YK48G_06240 [Lentilactobacillus fungorum]|uniref:HTH cro/C1-type domain-containing protein n=1 Tax=Lentilactobacillus fungorum TaxID=2201250 RepID=A0ABQ3VXY9_9LACO|nr:hypothetical protein YK48G_06240 [Lentilactobacillus fungorum]
MVILGQRIKEEREKNDWTQDQLAETLHVSRQAVSKWENGTAYPDIDRLIQLSDLFNITLDSLIKGDQDLQRKIVIGSDNHSQTNLWDFMNAKGWVMLFLIVCVICWAFVKINP